MRLVPTTAVDQPDRQALHRVRERRIGERTALVQEVQGLLNEYGIVIPHGVAQCRHAVSGTRESEQANRTPLSPAMLWTLVDALAAWETQRAYYQEQLAALATPQPAWQRLRTIAGIGP